MNSPLTTNQRTNSQIIRVANPALNAALASYAQMELAEEMAGRACETSLKAGPRLSESPQIDPEEFETVYLWFIS